MKSADDLNGFCSIHTGHFVTGVKGSGLFQCHIPLLLHLVRKEGRQEEVCIRIGSLDKLYVEETERLRKIKQDKYLQQYAFLRQ